MADNDELSLGKGERLPWLEPVDDPAAEEPIDRHKIIGFAIAFFVALAVVAASALHFVQTYGVVLDPSMLRNVLRTDETQARSTLTREAMIADFQAARAAGQIPSGDQ